TNERTNADNDIIEQLNNLALEVNSNSESINDTLNTETNERTNADNDIIEQLNNFKNQFLTTETGELMLDINNNIITTV
ncbi:MAG: hypothetical protein WCL70_04135, partial [Paludibacter sp.]